MTRQGETMLRTKHARRAAGWMSLAMAIAIAVAPASSDAARKAAAPKPPKPQKPSQMQTNTQLKEIGDGYESQRLLAGADRLADDLEDHRSVAHLAAPLTATVARSRSAASIAVSRSPRRAPACFHARASLNGSGGVIMRTSAT